MTSPSNFNVLSINTDSIRNASLKADVEKMQSLVTFRQNAISFAQGNPDNFVSEESLAAYVQEQQAVIDVTVKEVQRRLAQSNEAVFTKLDSINEQFKTLDKGQMGDMRVLTAALKFGKVKD